jgi:hypothetical protein
MTGSNNDSPAPKFPLGRVVATPGALELLARTNTTPLELLARHVCGDWGDLGADDARENDFSLQHGLRLLSAYKLPPPPSDTSAAAGTPETIWIITERDRSVTTLLLPEEY